MGRRVFKFCAIILALTIVRVGSGADAKPEERPSTEWIVSTAPGLDAILLTGVISGDVLQKRHYAETIEFVRSRMSEEALAAARRLDAYFRVENGDLTGPTLAYIFSAGSVDSLDSVIASADDPATRLRPGLMKTPLWDEKKYNEIRKLMPDVAVVLRSLKAIGFEEWYARDIQPELDSAITRIRPAVSAYDIIPEQARLLGRTLKPRIELLVVRFSMPYGIRISGQRFIAYYGNNADTLLRVAGHEIFHPPFDLKDQGLFRRLKKLAADPWVRSIVENHNPAFGYNSFEGVMNEDSAQALDQIVAERLGFARDPAKRWRHHDGGMHMIAAALYQAMKEDGFAARGGVYSDWLKSALDRGLLTPSEVRRRAALVVGESAVKRWYDIKKP